MRNKIVVTSLVSILLLVGVGCIGSKSDEVAGDEEINTTTVPVDITVEDVAAEEAMVTEGEQETTNATTEQGTEDAGTTTDTEDVITEESVPQVQE